MLERELIEEIRASNDIVSIVSSYIELKRQGSSMVGLCPFHNEKTPSFRVFGDRQGFHCFGCGVGGNVITFVMMIENYEFLDAVKFLAERANIAIEHKGDARQAKLIADKKKQLFEINKTAARFFYECLNGEAGAAASMYADERGLTKKIRVKCGLGYSPKAAPTLYGHLKNAGYSESELLESGLVVKSKSGSGFYDRFFDRLMFPIFDVTGKVAGFGGRAFGDAMPKYLNSSETPVFEKSKLLYGLNFARNSKKREMIVVEGYMDAVSLYQAGFLNTVASLGTAFTPHHARLIKNYADTVILLYDNDEAGAKAVYKAFPLLVKAGLNVKVAQTEGAKDPDEYVKKYGADKLSDILKSAKNHIKFQIDDEKRKYDITGSVEQRIAFTKQAARILKTGGSEIERDAYIKETARVTGISENAIRSEIELPEAGRINISRVRPKRALTTGDTQKKVIDAQRRFLGLIALNGEAYRKSLKYINEADFTNETYKDLYRLIAELQSQNKIIRAEEALTYPCFDTQDKHREVAGILSYYDGKESTPEIEKDFNNQIETIKLHTIDSKIRELREENDGEALKIALNERKTVIGLYISLSDG